MLFKSLLAVVGLVVSCHVTSALEYTDDGIAIVGTTEALNVNVAAGTSREDLISHEFASYIAVHFAGFNLPDGDSVVISSPDANVTLSHTYTGLGRDQSGTFIASFIPGNSVTVTYKSVGAASAGQGYRITGYSRGYPTERQESICGDGDQSLPAKCYAPGTNLSEGLPQAYTKAQAVARLLINGTYLCTGWLAGSEGHLFTNHHCFAEESWALSTDFEFGAESSSCSDQCETQLGCAGTVVATTSTFVADSEDIDYSVVRLPDCVDLSAYGYLQLRESGPVVNESIYVPQHPDGYAKRIASTVDGGANATILSVGEDADCGTDQVGHDVDTQGGSSGSPLISSSDNLVVAIHHCGGCTNTAIDVRTVLTDLAAKNITIANLVASDDVGQNSPPLYAQTPCSASKNATQIAKNKTMPCHHSNGSSSKAPQTSNSTSIASNATASPTPTATAATSTSKRKATPTPASTTVSKTATNAATNVSSTTTSTTTVATTTTATKTSSSKTALTSASVVTPAKKDTAAPTTTTKAIKTLTKTSNVTSSSSSSKTTTSSTITSAKATATSNKNTAAATMADCDSSPAPTSTVVDNNTIVGKLKAALTDASSTASDSADSSVAQRASSGKM